MVSGLLVKGCLDGARICATRGDVSCAAGGTTCVASDGDRRNTDRSGPPSEDSCDTNVVGAPLVGVTLNAVVAWGGANRRGAEGEELGLSLR